MKSIQEILTKSEHVGSFLYPDRAEEYFPDRLAFWYPYLRQAFIMDDFGNTHPVSNIAYPYGYDIHTHNFGLSLFWENIQYVGH